MCGLVTESVKADTSVINAQFEALLEQLETAIAQAASGATPDRSITLIKLAEEVTAVALGGAESTENLTEETTLSDGDYFPFYDVSASANRKTPWSNIVAKIRSALFGTLNGFLKANGSGTLSAVSTVPIANGGTGATTAAAARTNLNALSNADGAIVTANLGGKIVTAAKIADKTITAAQLADNISYTKFGLTANQVRTITAGTAAPSGGSDGDIYIKY